MPAEGGHLGDMPRTKGNECALCILFVLWRRGEDACILFDCSQSSSPGQLDHTQVSQRALSTYRSVLSAHRTQCPQPPITHDVCFLPSGLGRIHAAPKAAALGLTDRLTPPFPAPPCCHLRAGAERCRPRGRAACATWGVRRAMSSVCVERACVICR